MSSPCCIAHSRAIRREILLETEKSRGDGVAQVNVVGQTPGSRNERVPRVCLEKKTHLRIPAMNGGVCGRGRRAVVEDVRLGKCEVEQHGVKGASGRRAVDVDAVELLGEDMRPKDTANDFMDLSLAFLGSLATALLLTASRSFDGGGFADERRLRERLEVLVRPFNDTHIVEIATKGTIRNRESLNRTNFRFLKDATVDALKQIVDGLALEFAEQFSAHA